MKYEYRYKHYPDLDAAVDYAHFMQMRIVGFQYHPFPEREGWSVIFEQAIEEPSEPVSKPLTGYAEIEGLIMRLMDSACAVSNLKKPWSDNDYGRAASALCYVLPSDHPWRPRDENDWPLSRLTRFQVNPSYASDKPMTDRYGRRVRSVAEFKADLEAAVAENADFLDDQKKID
jgi:hypothetical protein